MEELLQKYTGAYASDFDVEASDTSSEALEPTTSEYEEESEEENSTSHSGMEERGSGPCKYTAIVIPVFRGWIIENADCTLL